ncbi:MAG: TonB-dependent receptor [Kiritimatiellae bacterium]|nr:TonB-dependent receptor [Kiritimatiellia bacterium]
MKKHCFAGGNFVCTVLLGALALAGCPPAGRAQSNAFPVQSAGPDTNTYLRVDEIVVLGTRLQNKIKNITSAVSVIDREKIDVLNADYVMDAICAEPSVYVRRDNIYGRQDTSIRGLGSNMRRIQTLIDGRPEKMSLFGCTVSQTLPLANVERIEVLRGPESVLYGTDAMGGVINIITRRRHDPGFETDGSIQYGSYGSLRGVVRHGGKIENFDYYAAYDHKQTAGYRPNGQYGADFGSLRLGQDLSDVWRLEAAGQYFADLGHDPGPENAPYVNNDTRQYKRGSWDASLSGKWDDSRFSVMAYQTFGNHNFNMPSIDDYWHSRDYTLGAKTEYSRTIFEGDELKCVPTVGYEYQYLWARPQDDWVEWARKNMPAKYMNFGSCVQQNNDLYAFNEMTWGRWVNTLGVRGHIDNVDRSVEPLPHIGLLRHLTESTTLRAKAARGFRQPRFSELYLYPAHNETLKPEDIWGYDVGLIQTVGSVLSVEVTPFCQQVHNMIQIVPNPTPPPQSINQNSGSFDMQGVELALEARPVKSGRLNLSYTYTDIDDAKTGNPYANRQGIPEHEVSFLAEYTVKKLRLSAEVQYIAGLYDSDILSGGAIAKVADYYVVNVKAAYPVVKYMEIFAGLDNLFDKTYEQVPGYPLPGITGYAGLRMRI